MPTSAADNAAQSRIWVEKPMSGAASRISPTPAAAIPNQTTKKAGMAISAIVRTSPRAIQCHHSGENTCGSSVCPRAPADGGASAERSEPRVLGAGKPAD